MHDRAARWVSRPAGLAIALESLLLAAAAAVGRRPSQAALLCAAKCDVATSLQELQTVAWIQAEANLQAQDLRSAYPDSQGNEPSAMLAERRVLD